jgi:hypothetical protein
MNATQPHPVVHCINLGGYSGGYCVNYSRGVNGVINVSVPTAPSFNGPMVDNEFPLKIYNKISRTCRQMYRSEEFSVRMAQIKKFIMDTVDNVDPVKINWSTWSTSEFHI